ncbi:fibronectin type III domain-containing protein [Chryseosolibacter indicus]|uniref:Fibronectin type III domain-containing protein n=1 Tax=Chryseosolibacter indicus TaxID=2782351 RepID=A0ABS5VM83_9BACT|nr:fibronectin type III domain-containing protein [Chryseosolibacter indicus]MBT1701839.1 fibronectin type III domain-containing protein [Chryseosolibacter indicus]
MRRILISFLIITSVVNLSIAQVDTSFIYNPNMPYGTLDLRLAKSATQYYYLQEDITFSFREDPPGVKTKTFRDMTSFDSSPYKEGNLREKNGSRDLFVMNYRILFPKNYDPNFAQGYPIIFMLHGWGETGNCWERDCYWSDAGYNPNTNNPPAPTSPSHELLNNDRNLYLGGSQHLAAVNLAGSLLPDNPSMPGRAFPGLVLFPQSLNGWLQTAPVEDAIKLLRLILKKYNIDENRVYIHGLSNGGAGVNNVVKRAPWLFASVLTMSAVSDGGIVSQNQIGEASKIPYWIFQGGQDTNPTPGKTYNFVRSLRDNGAVVRYYLYTTLGHATWNSAFRETDFYSWNLQQRKTNPHISYGNPVICKTTNTGVTISFSKGFLAYQWEKDGQIINGATGAEYVATTVGRYRGRFSRKSTSPSSSSEWEPWSDPIIVSEVNLQKPAIEVTGTTHLRGPGLTSTNDNNTVTLKSSETAELYEWFKNGQLINFTNTDIDDTLRTVSFTSSSSSTNGAYTLRIKNSYCPSPQSDPVYLFFNNSAQQNINLNSASADMKGVATASTVFLSWNDVLSNETGYEIWRRKTGTTSFRFAGRTQANAISFLDTSLEPSTTYEYKLRAINNTGRSNYIPSDDLNLNFKITTLNDRNLPSAPQNLVVTGNTINTISIKWDQATDDGGVKEYIIEYGNAKILTGSANTSFTITNLNSNTIYPVKVMAVDFSGKQSQPSNQVIANTYVTSLSYKHSTGTWSSLDEPSMKATWTNPEYVGTINNFSLAPRTQEDYFNFQFTGYLNITTSGTYTFRITSDDGSRLILNGTTIIDNNGTHGNVTKTSEPIQLNAGFHPIEVQYFDYNGGQSLTVQYMGPGIGNGSTFVNIPDAALKSGTFTPPTPPSAPSSLIAQTLGMQKIALSWNYNDDTATDYEIYRSTTGSEPFLMVGRSTGLTFIDSINLIPGKIFYYKAKSVNGNGSSPFSNVTNATTTSDNIPPTVPGGLTLLSKTNTSISFNWEPSSDNIGISGYEVLENGVVISNASINAYTASNLKASQSYNFSVRAIDLSGNRSGISEILTYYNGMDYLYYSLASGNLNDVNTWKTNPDGTGDSPLNFTDVGQQFIIANRTSSGIGGEWTVTGERSKIVIPPGVSLTIDNSCFCKIDLQGTLNLETEVSPEFVNISPSSVINFNGATRVPKNNYGNINLTGSTKTFDSDTISIQGNLTVGNGVSLYSTSPAVLKMAKDLIVNGALSNDSESSITLHFTENTSHLLQTQGDLSVFGISIGRNGTVTLKTTKPINLTSGTSNGGGLKLLVDAVLVLDQNNLQIEGTGTINSNLESGRISIQGGDVIINSNAAETSNLFFDRANHQIKYFEVDVAGSVSIKENVDIIQGVKIKRGVLNSDGHINLIATENNYASVYPIENNGMISGDVQVQVYHKAAGKVLKNLSAPVKNVSVSILQNSVPITGNFVGSSTGLGSDASMFEFDAVNNSWRPFPSPGSSNSEMLEVGKGYSVLMYNGTSPATIKFNGPLNQHNISFNLSGSSSSDASAGWNLIGNPFASSISWNNSVGWSKSGVSNILLKQKNTIVDGVNITQYQYFDPLLGDVSILPGEAFWVKAFTANPSLTISESAKILAQTNSYPSTNSDTYYLGISLQQQSLSDDTYLVFSSDGTDQYDALLDAGKRKNTGVFNLSTTVDKSTMLAVNHLNTAQCAKTIYLNIEDAKPGSYALKFTNLSRLINIWKIQLHDAFTNTVTTLTQSTFNFTVTDNVNSYGLNRFYLTFQKVSFNMDNHIIETTTACTPYPAEILIRNAQEGVKYTAITSNGKRFSSIANGKDDLIIHIPHTELSLGTNKLSVEAGFEGCEVYPLESNVVIDLLQGTEVNIADKVRVCTASDVTLTASGAIEGGHYRWFDSAQNEIQNANSATLVVSSPVNGTAYYVSAVAPSGCESERKSVVLYVDVMEEPVITLSNDTLWINNSNVDYQWFVNEEVIEGATNNFFIPQAPGEYTVEISNAECSVKSKAYLFNLVSNEPLDENFNISIYPNPTTGSSINVDVITSRIIPLKLQVLDLTGSVLYERNIEAKGMLETLTIEFSNTLTEGIYIIQIKQGDKEIRKKIVVRN